MAATKNLSRWDIYSVHPSVEMLQDWIMKLPEKTGKSLGQWLRYIKKEGPPTEEERCEWLKKEHGMGTNTAMWLAERAEGRTSPEDSPESYLAQAPKYVDEMYAGAKAALRPLHDQLIELARSVAKGVKVCPCKTIVPIFRKHVIAQIKPATRTRIDVGFALGDTKPRGRLIDTGGFAKKDRITHRIPISAPENIDAEVKRWLQVAYDRDA